MGGRGKREREEGREGGARARPPPPPTHPLLLLQGLPADELSIQNGTLVTRASRVPLLIDPQGQATAWLAARAARAGAPLRTLRADDPKFGAGLEAALADGGTLIVDWRGGDFDPALEPLLNGRHLAPTPGAPAPRAVAIGDKEVDVGPGFALALATPDAAPPLTPELCARVAVVDFTVTQTGLEDQLLDRLVRAERADLQERRSALVAESAAARARVASLEADLLTRLSSAQGNLIDDADLVAVLAVTKREAAAAVDRLAAAADTRATLRAAADEFRPAAARGALLYFLVLDFGGVNPMYATGLAQVQGRRGGAGVRVAAVAAARGRPPPTPTLLSLSVLPAL